MSLTRAVHFKNWANLLEARGMLPDVMRKLIWARVPDGSKVNIPAYEQTNRPGEDGFVVATISDEFIPNGTSVWEMGANSDKRKKANDDYSNRTAATPKDIRKKTTFVFVTPREWQTKDDWAEDKGNEGKWKDVVVIDCNDLEHWMDRCIAVDLWFAQQTGQPSDGFIELNRRWQDIQNVGTHQLTTDVILVGRDSTCDSVTTFLQGPPSATLLRSSSIQDGIDFLAALNSQSAVASQNSNQMIVVCDGSHWQRVSVNLTPISLVVPAWIALTTEDVQRAVNSGHHVMVVGQRDSTFAGQRIELPRQNVYELESLLVDCGFPASTARFASIGSAGSTAILKRLISTSPASELPQWAKDEHAGQLAVFALIGGWDTSDSDSDDPFPFFSSRPADSLILEDFMGWSHEELLTQVSRWSQCDDPLFITYGDIALVSSRESAWHLLGRAITEPMLNKFIELAAFVLGDNDPAFQLPADQRWAAAIHGKTHDCSAEMRNGIIETLVLMTTIPIYAPNGNRRDFSVTVRKIMQRLLPKEMAWQRWATLDRQLPVIAEADPEFLLDTLELDLKKSTPQIPLLFSQCGTGIFEGSYHCGLLWSLEVMAWNPKYLFRVAAVLAALSEHESLLPQNYGNRPSRTFNGIFQHWYPGTSATADERLAVLDQLIQQSEASAWDRLVDLVDEIDSSVDGTQSPRWQTWADGYAQTRVDAERRSYIGGLVKRTISAAADSPERWNQIFRNLLLRVSDSVADQTIAKLRKFADSPNKSTAMSNLWSEVDDVVRWQQQLTNASDYKITDSRLGSLVSIRDDMKPDDPVYTHEWLFQDPAELPGLRRSDDFNKYEKELERLQRIALREIYDSFGTEGIMRHLACRHRGHGTGWSCAAESLLSTDEVIEMLDSEDIRVFDFASGYVAGRFATTGIRCLDEFQVTTLPEDVAVKVLTAIVSQRIVWNWVEEHASEDLESAFWSRANSFCQTESVADVEYCANKLLDNGRPFAACKLLQLKLDDQNPGLNLILRSLETGYGGHHAEGADELDSYAIQKLVEHLQSSNVDPTRLALIEWGYLPILSSRTSRTKPTTLQQYARLSPAFFFTLIKASSAPMVDPNEDRSQHELIEFHRRHSRKLLAGLVAVPGEVDSAIDMSKLTEWVSELRTLAADDTVWEHTGHAIGNWLARRCLLGESGKLDVVEPVFDVLETMDDESIFDGFYEGVVNGRGASGRLPFDGGNQEREFVMHYLALASQIALTYPKLSVTVDRIAKHYSAYASHEDQDASRRRLRR